jgi:hypothetical protein
MAPPQPIVVLDPLPWSRSSVTEFALPELVNGGLLAPNVEGAPPVWIALSATDREPNLPFGYVVSFVRHHERGFTTPVSRFMRGLCYHYRVELHNFAPNTISQAATFVGVYEGFLGIPVNWDLWVHLFRAELHIVATTETRVRRAVRADGLTFSVWDLRKEWYVPCMMTSNNMEWEKGWFYLRNKGTGLPLHWQGAEGEDRHLAPWLIPFLALGSAGVTPQWTEEFGGRRRIVPLMERRLCIYEMAEDADPIVLARSRLLREHFPREYAATRVRRAVNLRTMATDNDDLWSFIMLPDTPPVSRLPPFLSVPRGVPL